MHYQAKILELSDMIEEEVVVDINGLKFTGFASVMPYKVELNKTYPVELGLVILDEEEIIELDDLNEKKELIRIGDSFKYTVFGKIYDDTIDVGHDIRIQDDIFHDLSYLKNKYIKIKVDRLAIYFI